MKTNDPRPCCLINFKTGRIIFGDSICEFCRKAGLNGNDKYHITPILDKARFHHKGWTHTDNFKTTYTLEDIYNNTYTFDNWLAFSKEHHIDSNILWKLINGQITYYRGLFVKGSRPPLHKPRQQKVFTFRRGSKEITTSDCMSLSQKFKVNRRALYSLTSGERHFCDKKRPITLVQTNVIIPNVILKNGKYANK